MDFAFVRRRDGKRSLNIVAVLLVGVFSAAIGTGLAFLIAALLPASPMITTLTRFLPLLLPLLVVMPPLIRGLRGSTNRSSNPNDCRAAHCPRLRYTKIVAGSNSAALTNPRQVATTSDATEDRWSVLRMDVQLSVPADPALSI